MFVLVLLMQPSRWGEGTRENGEAEQRIQPEWLELDQRQKDDVR